jgi:xanthine dehydrogenase YagR molybdenum-binding subunit
MTIASARAALAAPDRVEGPDKVTGAARYAYEYAHGEVAYAAIVPAAIAKGAVRAVDGSAALALPGVLAVLSCENTPRLHRVDDAELALFQSRGVAYRGQIVAAVVADSHETAEQAERLVRIQYDEEPHDVELHVDHPRLYKPDRINPNFETDTEQGDCDQALAAAEVTVDRTYQTAAVHNNPMEPHATLAVWDGDAVTLYDSNQGATRVQDTVASVFGLSSEQVRVVAPTSVAGSAPRGGCGRTSSSR